MFICKGPPSLHSRFSHLVLTFIIIVLFFHTIRISNQHAMNAPLLRDAEVIPEGNASPEELYLARLARECGLSKETSWMAWRIAPSEQSEEWPSVTEVNLNFKSVTPKTVSLKAPDRMDLYAKKRMELPVPASPLLGQVDASDFLFGVSTTYARVVDRDYAMIKAWARWLTDGHQHSNGASLVVVLDQASNDHLEEVDKTLQASGIDCWVTTTEEPMSMARRYLELSRILKTFAANLAANGQDKRWFGLVEDDVFFPSLSYLRDRLFTYNTDGEHYIGLPSERLDWEAESGLLKTYGGGAILLTRTAVSRVPNLPCFETTSSMPTSGRGISSFRSRRWDELIHDCMMRHSDLDMHVLPGFFSPNDELYDPSVDSYETGMQPLLLRRYAERHLLNINKAHLVTNVCGESCFMQRYLFHDNWVLVNGISITEYPDGVQIQRGESPRPDKLRKRSGVPESKPEPKTTSGSAQEQGFESEFEGKTETDAEKSKNQNEEKDDTPRSTEEGAKDKAEDKIEGENPAEASPEPETNEAGGTEDGVTVEELNSGRLTLPQRVVVDDNTDVVDKAILSWSGRKNVWRLVDSAVSKDGTVWQAYVKKAKNHPGAVDENEPKETDSVIVLIWEHGKTVA